MPRTKANNTIRINGLHLEERLALLPLSSQAEILDRCADYITSEWIDTYKDEIRDLFDTEDFTVKDIHGNEIEVSEWISRFDFQARVGIDLDFLGGVNHQAEEAAILSNAEISDFIAEELSSVGGAK